MAPEPAPCGGGPPRPGRPRGPPRRGAAGADRTAEGGEAVGGPAAGGGHRCLRGGDGHDGDDGTQDAHGAGPGRRPVHRRRPLPGPPVPVGARRCPGDRCTRVGRRRRCDGARRTRRRAGRHSAAAHRRGLRASVPGRPEPRICRRADGASAPPAAAAGAAARRGHRRGVPGGKPARPSRVRRPPRGDARRRTAALLRGAARTHPGRVRRPRSRLARASRRRRHRHLRPGAGVVDRRTCSVPATACPARSSSSPGSSSCTPSPGTPRSSGACRWCGCAARRSVPRPGRVKRVGDVVLAASRWRCSRRSWRSARSRSAGDRLRCSSARPGSGSTAGRSRSSSSARCGPRTRRRPAPVERSPTTTGWARRQDPAPDLAGRTAAAVERAARRHEPGRAAAGAAVLRRRVHAAVPLVLARHRVPAGLTGWAQVHGLRGDTSIADRARFDNYLHRELVAVGRRQDPAADRRPGPRRGRPVTTVP